MSDTRSPGSRAFGLLVVLGGVCLAAAGCSPAYSSAGQLAQAASDAAAQTQTGALTLRLSAAQRLVSPAAQTALSDAIEKLGQDDSSLTSADVSGSLDAARKRILGEVRTGEDLLAHGRQLDETGAGPGAVAAVVRRLQATAKRLSSLQQRLEGSG
jgi:hypothetical protein